MAALNRRSVLYHGEDFISVPLRLIINNLCFSIIYESMSKFVKF